MATRLAVAARTTVNACGHSAAATADALQRGRSGLRRVEYPDGLVTHVGAVDAVEDVTLPARLERFDCRNNRLAHLALAADGFTDSVARAVAKYGSDRVAVILGTTTSGVAEGERAFRARNQDGSLPSWYDFDHTQDYHSLARFVAASLGVSGPQLTTSAACASSTKVFGDAWQWIRQGLCDAAIVGGVDSLCDMTIRGFKSLELLAKDPCRPFDAARAGLSIGEAAGFILLERHDADGPDGIVVEGYGESSDAYHLSAPHPEGLGAKLAMRAALGRAGLDPSQIDYINLHGTGTPANDAAEDRAVVDVFGTAVAASSTKGFTGHTLGAAGITEAVIACVCLEGGFAPANLNLASLDPKVSTNILTAAHRGPIRHVLSNSFGFGGANAAVILGRG